MSLKPQAEQPSPSRSDIEKDLARLDALKSDFDQELTRSEKTGDFSKSMALKKEIDDRVAALKARVETMRAFGPAPAQEDEKADLDFAEKLFGQDYIGQRQIEDTWGLDIQREQVPEIPFSRTELERAKASDQFLILRAAKNRYGTLLTMAEMYDVLNDSMVERGRGKLLANKDELMKLDSHFFEDEPPVLGPDFAWALTAKKILPSSTSRHYVSQTDVIAQYVERELFPRQTGPYAKALGEYNRSRANHFGVETYEQIKEKLTGSNWQFYANMLTDLKINMAMRQSAPQALFDVATYYEVNNERLLERGHIWTTSQSTNKEVICLGDFDAMGATVYTRNPGLGSDTVGVLISRTF
jgi:hypothetical protein